MIIENAKIERADISMEDHGCLTYNLTLVGNGWGCVFGGISIGNGYLGADKFTGSAAGLESLMHIMNTVGVSRWNDIKGKYVRAKFEGSSVRAIGNIIEDKWFDQEEFFADKEL